MSSISARSAYGLRSAAFTNGPSRFCTKNPSPGSCLGGFGRPGEGTVPIGAALTTTMRRTSVVRIAWMMARVPCQAIPASDADRGPRPEITASAPSTADSSAAGSGAARSAVTTRASPDSPFGLRTTAVTSWPAATACSRTCRPIPPVAAKIVSFICCSLAGERYESCHATGTARIVWSGGSCWIVRGGSGCMGRGVGVGEPGLVAGRRGRDRLLGRSRFAWGVLGYEVTGADEENAGDRGGKADHRSDRENAVEAVDETGAGGVFYQLPGGQGNGVRCAGGTAQCGGNPV